MATFHVKDVCAAFTSCNRLLILKPPAAEAAWKTIEPFVTCTDLEGEFPLGNDTLIQMILAVAADAKFELGHLDEAAFLFSEALQHEGSCGFADRYAMLVVKNDMTDHIAPAMQAVERSERQWMKKPWALRCALRVVWFVWFVIPHPHIWHEYRETARYKDLLRTMARKSLPVNPDH